MLVHFLECLKHKFWPYVTHFSFKQITELKPWHSIPRPHYYPTTVAWKVLQGLKHYIRHFPASPLGELLNFKFNLPVSIIWSQYTIIHCSSKMKVTIQALFSSISLSVRPVLFVHVTHLVFLRISSTNCLMWSSMNSIFSCLRASAFCRRTMRSTSTALSTSGKLSTTTTEGPNWLSGDLSSTPLLPPWRAFKEPVEWRGDRLRQTAYWLDFGHVWTSWVIIFIKKWGKTLCVVFVQWFQVL